jgi:hypothetical protein
MNSEWQTVKARRRKRRGMGPRPPYVSINRRGEIAMNAAAFKAIGEPWNVALYYQPGFVGVKFPVWQDREFFRVRRYGRGRKMRIVSASRLLKQFGLQLDHILKFHNTPVVIYRNEPMLLLDLSLAK